MGFHRIFAHVQLFAVVVVTANEACSTPEACSVDEETTSMIQIHRVENDTSACVKFFVQGCQMNASDVPQEFPQMRATFMKCCLENSYGNAVCDLAAEDIFDDEPPGADICLKFADVQDEHERVSKLGLLQQRAAVKKAAVASDADMDTVTRGKLGFGPPQRDFFCVDSWQEGLKSAHFQPNLRKCKRECEFAPTCTAISYSDTKQCVLCVTPTMGYLPSWTTYVKQGTTRRSKQTCKDDEDCDYQRCNLHGRLNWEFHCYKKEGRRKGRCTNRRMYAKKCASRFENESPFPGQWCHNEHLYRMCPRRQNLDPDESSDEFYEDHHHKAFASGGSKHHPHHHGRIAHGQYDYDGSD